MGEVESMKKWLKIVIRGIVSLVVAIGLFFLFISMIRTGPGIPIFYYLTFISPALVVLLYIVWLIFYLVKRK